MVGQRHADLHRRHADRWPGGRRCPQRRPGDRRQGRNPWRDLRRGRDRARQGGRPHPRPQGAAVPPPAMSKATSCTKPLRWKPAPSSKAIAATPTIRWATIDGGTRRRSRPPSRWALFAPLSPRPCSLATHPRYRRTGHRLAGRNRRGHDRGDRRAPASHVSSDRAVHRSGQLAVQRHGDCRRCSCRVGTGAGQIADRAMMLAGLVGKSDRYPCGASSIMCGRTPGRRHGPAVPSSGHADAELRARSRVAAAETASHIQHSPRAGRDPDSGMAGTHEIAIAQQPASSRRHCRPAGWPGVAI